MMFILPISVISLIWRPRGLKFPILGSIPCHLGSLLPPNENLQYCQVIEGGRKLAANRQRRNTLFCIQDLRLAHPPAYIHSYPKDK